MYKVVDSMGQKEALKNIPGCLLVDSNPPPFSPSPPLSTTTLTAAAAECTQVLYDFCALSAECTSDLLPQHRVLSLTVHLVAYSCLHIYPTTTPQTSEPAADY